MTAMQNVSLGAHYVVYLPEPDDFAFWRERARGLIQCDVPPDRVSWVENRPIHIGKATHEETGVGAHDVVIGL
ncbi:MAG: hypothetical protein AAFY51_05410, partial [Pseudomonadota bacterium]